MFDMAQHPSMLSVALPKIFLRGKFEDLIPFGNTGTELNEANEFYIYVPRSIIDRSYPDMVSEYISCV